MARHPFAIEAPRKISISIEGYDPDAQRRAQQRSQQKRSRRLKRLAEARAKQQEPSIDLGRTPIPNDSTTLSTLSTP